MSGVSNSSPLIYLPALGDLELLRDLFGLIRIPEAVYREVVVNGRGQPGGEEIERATGDWIDVIAVKDRGAVLRTMASARIQVGEAEAIELATELGEDSLVMDDRSAVRYARSLGFRVVPTGSIYVAAKRLGLIRSVTGKLDDLREKGFRLTGDAYALIVQAAGE